MSQEQMRSSGEASLAGTSRKLTWSDEAIASHGNHATNYSGTLKAISESLARVQKSEYVVENHVLEGHASFVRCGLNSLSWLSRPETYAALGGILIGAAWGTSDTVSLFFDDPPWRKAFGGGSFCVLIALGIFFFIFGRDSARPIDYRSLPERISLWLRSKTAFDPILFLLWLAIVVAVGFFWWRDHNGLMSRLDVAESHASLSATGPAVNGSLHAEQAGQSIVIRGEVVIVVESATYRYVAIPDGMGKFVLAPLPSP